MKNYRIYVEKLPRFQVEADTLRKELNNNLGLNLRSLRLLNVYDLFGFSEELLEKIREKGLPEMSPTALSIAFGKMLKRNGKAYGSAKVLFWLMTMFCVPWKQMPV